MNEEERERNRELIERFPFLYDPDEPDFTWLDAMPDGWRMAFGEKMCEEIREALVSENALKTYRIYQVKEKYGGLRWYDSGRTYKVDKIVNKYEMLSYRTCVDCGEPATCMSTGYILPFCDRCAREEESHFMPRFIPIDEYMRGE